MCKRGWRFFNLWLLLCMGAQALASAPLVRWEPPAWGPLSSELGLGFSAGRIADAQRVVARGAHFFTPGPDQVMGTPDDVRMRWYGINLAGVAAFPPPERAADLARTLASWGFNAVRIHYIDAPPHPDPSVVNSVLSDGPYPSFNPVAISRLRRLLAELRERGLYVQLNPIAAYTLRPQQDGVPPLGAPRTDAAQTRLPANNPLAAIHPALLQRQQTYLKQLAQQLDLAAQPALAQIDAVNESSLMAAWTQWDANQWQHTVSGEYAQLLAKSWSEWVDARYGGLPEALKAWDLPPSSALPQPTPTHPEGTSSPEATAHADSGPNWWTRWTQWPQWRRRLMRLLDLLPATWRSTVTAWLQPDATATTLLLTDYLGFLADMDQRHFKALRATLHTHIRPDLPVTGTQVSYGNGWSTVSQVGMDFVDDHFYVDHYQFPEANWNMANWYTSREALSGQAWSRLAGAAALRDRTRPYVISELGQPYPNPLGPEMALTLATLARLQDWDGLFLFDHDAFDPERRAPGHFDIQGDWPRAMVSALSARVFLAGDLTPLVALPGQSAEHGSPSAFTAAWLRQRRPDYWTREGQLSAPPTVTESLTLWGYGTPLAHTARTTNATNGTNPHTAHPLPQTTTGPEASALSRHSANRLTATWSNGAWASGRFIGASKGEMGEMGGVQWELPVGQDEQLATLVLISGDQQPLPESRHWLLGVVTPTVGSRMGSSPPAPQSWVAHPSGSDRWTLASAPGAAGPSDAPSSMPPLWTEPTRLRIELPARAQQAEVWQLNAVGERTAAVKLTPGEDGRWRLPLASMTRSGQPPPMWFDIRWPAAPP